MQSLETLRQMTIWKNLGKTESDVSEIVALLVELACLKNVSMFGPC